MNDPLNTSATIKNFRKARTQAALEEILARLSGKSADLLCYPDVREKLKVEDVEPGVLKEIPLDAIVGSVERCYDFTRSFLPRQGIGQHRWRMVKKNLIKWPPIRVYQIDQVYFVLDGHHRVSVARQLSVSHIPAYVIKVRTRVSLSPESQPDDLIVQAKHVDFLERTRLDELRPEANLSVSVPGQYRVIEQHIKVHRHFPSLEQGRETHYQEAVVYWYDEVYWPIVKIIRERGLLRDFPGRTETDLYLWLLEYRTALEEKLGREVGPEAVAASLTIQFSSRPWHAVARIGGKVLNAVMSALSKTRQLANQHRSKSVKDEILAT